LIESRHITNIVAEKRREQLDLISPHVFAAIDADRRRPGLRRIAATALVRLGAALDREALLRIPLTRQEKIP
jgi:hypothetical protein